MSEKNNVIENLISALHGFEKAGVLQTQEAFNDLQRALPPVINLLDDRISRHAKKDRGKVQACSLLEKIKVLANRADDAKAVFSVLKSIQHRQDMIIEKMIFNLENTLIQVVGPAIKAAANARDNQAVTQWGQADIFINDLMLNYVLNLQTTAHHYLAEGNAESAQILWAIRDNLAGDLAAWKEMGDGKYALTKTCDQVFDNLKAFTDVSKGLPDLFRRMAGNRTAIRNEIPALLKELTSFTENTGTTEKSSPIKKLFRFVSIPG